MLLAMLKVVRMPGNIDCAAVTKGLVNKPSGWRRLEFATRVGDGMVANDDSQGQRLINQGFLHKIKGAVGRLSTKVRNIGIDGDDFCQITKLHAIESVRHVPEFLLMAVSDLGFRPTFIIVIA